MGFFSAIGNAIAAIGNAIAAAINLFIPTSDNRATNSYSSSVNYNHRSQQYSSSYSSSYSYRQPSNIWDHLEPISSTLTMYVILICD